MEARAWLRFMAMALVLPLAIACGRADEETEVDMEVETEHPAEPSVLAAPVTVRLQPMGGSTVSGEATATHESDQVNVRLTVDGLTEGGDYEAKLKYGSCTMAQSHFDPVDGPIETTPGFPGTWHEPGDEFAEIELTVTGGTGTGSADIGTDELGPSEAAYIAIELDDNTGDEDQLLACADLSGHDGMSGTGGATAPGTERSDTSGR